MLTIATYEEETHKFYARTLDADAASGEIVIPGKATDDEIRDYANENLGAPECGDFNHAIVVWEEPSVTTFPKKGYYQADTANGVTFYDTHLDIEEADVLDPWPFYESLSGLDDNEIIYGFFDNDPGLDDMKVLQRIENEYGIR